MASVNDGSNSNSQEVDLNLAPILDAFVVLITFLLISASFLSIGILDAGIAAAGKTASSSTPPPIKVAIDLNSNHSITVKITGSVNQTYHVAAKDKDWNLEGLDQRLLGIKKSWPTVNAATLTAKNQVEYKDVVQAMARTRKNLPVVLLGGF